MAKQFDAGDNTIDSRDVITAIKELEAIEERDEDEQEELDELLRLRDNADRAPAWGDGAVLVLDSYFLDYAQELARNTGAFDSKLEDQWPYSCIDWDEAARHLQGDYFKVEFWGYWYWIQS